MLVWTILLTIATVLLALSCVALAVIWFLKNNLVCGIWMLLMAGLNVFNIVSLWM